MSTLRHNRLFAGLNEMDLREIGSCCVLRTLEKNAYLFHEGDPVLGFYLVQEGMINLHRITEGGREQVVRVFRAGESFAEAVLAGMEGYPVSARAESAAKVLLVRKAELLRLIQRQPEVALRIIGSMSRHFQHLVSQIDGLRDRSVRERLQEWLLQRCPQPLVTTPMALELPGTKGLLAAELGTVAETLSRTLAVFRQQGWITVEGRCITITNPAEFAQVDVKLA